MKVNFQRPKDCSKNDFGHVLVIGGEHGMGGAAIMAAEAACRTGAGRVTVLTREENLTALLTRLPNAMSLFPKKLDAKIFAHKTVIAIGCGLGRSTWGKKLFELAMKSNLPKIIDADALNILSESKKKFDLSKSILTPHVGEAARLLGVTPEEIQQDRHDSIKKLCKKFGATVVLKGNKTLVSAEGKNIYQCPHGNAGMATAGMGDVLSGIIAGLVAQHFDLESAAISGVKIHALAGDEVAKKQGEIGMIPTDLIAQIPLVILKQIQQ